MRGESKPRLFIGDADALIALSNKSDSNHEAAKQILTNLSSETSVIFPTTAICEAVTVLRGKLNKPTDAAQVVQQLRAGGIPLESVDQAILLEAEKLYDPLASKKNTLFDAVVAAIAKQSQADAVFSFDQWYQKIGLKLASDLSTTSSKTA